MPSKYENEAALVGATPSPQTLVEDRGKSEENEEAKVALFTASLPTDDDKGIATDEDHDVDRSCKC